MDLMEVRRGLLASMGGKVGQFTKYQKITATVTNGVLEVTHTLGTVPIITLVSIDDISSIRGNSIAYFCAYRGDTAYFAPGGVRVNGGLFSSFDGITTDETTTVADNKILIGQNKLLFLSTSTVVIFPENAVYSIELYA